MVLIPEPSKQVFIAYREPEVADAMRILLQEKLVWGTTAPDHMESFPL
ncbi:hypothetical protein [Pseudomaricurvus sp.]